MRVVALEEHFTVPALVKRIGPEAVAKRGFVKRKYAANRVSPLELLPEIGEKRLAAMDATGITVQVLSTTGPGADLVDGKDGVDMAREINDAPGRGDRAASGSVRRLRAPAMREPEAAAKELERGVRKLGFHGAMVNGMTRGPLPRRCAVRADPGRGGGARRADLHPPGPGAGARAQALLQRAALGFARDPGGGGLGLAFGDGDPRAAAGAVGRARPASQAQAHHRPHGRGAADDAGALPTRCSWPTPTISSRPISKTILDQVWITTSGIFSEPPFLAALLTFGIDRILYSVDYPYAPNERGRDFLQGGGAVAGRPGEARARQCRPAAGAQAQGEMKAREKKDFPVGEVRRFLEPGPIVLVSSAWKGKTNIMTMGWHMVMEFEPSLIGCYIWTENHSFEMMRRSKECVINIPTVDLAAKVVGIGNTLGPRRRQVRGVRADGGAGHEGRGAADRRVLRELRVPAGRREPDRQVQPVRARGGEGARGDVAEVSAHAALPRRRRVHDLGHEHEPVSQAFQGAEFVGCMGSAPCHAGRGRRPESRYPGPSTFSLSLHGIWVRISR